MGRRWMRWVVVAAVVSAAAVAHGQAALMLQQDGDGILGLSPGVTLPESPAWMECTTTSGSAFDCLAVTAPINDVVDGSGTGLAETSETLEVDFGLTLAQPTTRVAEIGIDATYRPEYSDIELSAMGAITGTLPGTLGSIYTEGAGFEQRTVAGDARSLGRTYAFACNITLTNNVTTYYCSFAGATAQTSVQDDQETPAAQACAHVGMMSVVALTSADPPVRSTIPASCQLNLGLSINNSNTGTLVSLPATTGVVTATPATDTAWDVGDERAVWALSTGAGCTGTRRIGIEVGCD